MRVAVVGLGKLGACMAAVFAQRGHQVIGLDTSPAVVDKMAAAKAPVQETGLGALLVEANSNLKATLSAYEAVRQSDIAFIIVPSPSDDDGGFSNRYVLEAVEALGKEIRRVDPARYTIVISSTVMPGSCDGPIRQQLELAANRPIGPRLGLCYSPEFIALGSVIDDLQNPDMVLLGAADIDSADDLYEVLQPVPVNEPKFCLLSLTDAEIAKISVNAYVTMKISFANTLGEICSRFPGADASCVAQAIGNDRRIGPHYLKPGAAFGGPCFPRDNEAFAALAHQVGTSAELALATDVVNRRQVLILAAKLSQYADVSVLGIAYKPATAVSERSFGRELVELLQFEGIRVHTFDPLHLEPINGNNVCDNAQACVNASDVVVIATPDKAFRDLKLKGKTVYDLWGLVDSKEDCDLRRFGRDE